MPVNASNGMPPGGPGAPPLHSLQAAWKFGTRERRFVLSVAIATLVLGSAWIVAVRGAMADALYSYIVLIPCISTWLVWQRRETFQSLGKPGIFPGAVGLVLALACGLGGVLAWRQSWITEETSWLTTQMAAWVFFVQGAAAFHFGTRWVKDNLFAVAFLLFAIPFPEPAVAAIEFGLQTASATASDELFRLAGETYTRTGMAFKFTTITILVAPECSGIRSTLVLFITGVLGAHLLLRNTFHRITVVSVIIPLGIFRNALRIVTLTLLSVHVKPEIMDSALHKRGGPLFFAVSLIPLFVLFWWFGRREKKAQARVAASR